MLHLCNELLTYIFSHILVSYHALHLQPAQRKCAILEPIPCYCVINNDHLDIFMGQLIDYNYDMMIQY
jgi:hypothetical protein